MQHSVTIFGENILVSLHTGFCPQPQTRAFVSHWVYEILPIVPEPVTFLEAPPPAPGRIKESIYLCPYTATTFTFTALHFQ